MIHELVLASMLQQCGRGFIFIYLLFNYFVKCIRIVTSKEKKVENCTLWPKFSNWATQTITQKSKWYNYYCSCTTANCSTTTIVVVVTPEST